jgi:predicted  nucleic acid-binding Zn-ribbon protein
MKTLFDEAAVVSKQLTAILTKLGEGLGALKADADDTNKRLLAEKAELSSVRAELAARKVELSGLQEQTGAAATGLAELRKKVAAGLRVRFDGVGRW